MSKDTPGNLLVSRLRSHNPWWEAGAEALSDTLPDRRRSDFYHLARPDDGASQFEDQPVLGLVGRRGVGKTTLLRQFIHHRLQAGDEPERFCYVPFDADPLYQLQSDDQLAEALRYYESRVLGSLENPDPHFLLLDDVHQVEHPSKPAVEGWGTPVVQATATPGRHVVVTASAEIQVTRELERAGVDDRQYDVQPILPEKFRDYLYTLRPGLEAEETRVSPTPLRAGEGSLPAALSTASPGHLAETIRDEHEKIADEAARIRPQLPHYLAMGGLVSYAGDGPVTDTRTLGTEPFTELREAVRDALYQDVPGFESVRNIADLERLCAFAARTRAREPVTYRRLVELFDVDRRTISDSYLPTLTELFLLTGATEYDNERPRSIRLYPRDTGLVTALTDTEATDVLDDPALEADYARIATFDHTMRFVYGIEAAQNRERPPTVWFWNGEDGVVDFVFEVDETPVPVGLALRPPTGGTTAAVRSFLQRYDSPLGFVLTGDTVPRDRPVEHEDGLISLPLWLYLLLC